MSAREVWTAPPPSPTITSRTGRWLTLPAVLAPVALIGGWSVAAALRPGFSSRTGTISDLAATTAPHRWIMTLGFVITGVCLVSIAAGLRPARWPGRLVLAVAGIGVLAVAAQPLPGHAAAHSAAAFLSFTALAGWPILAATGRGPRVLSVTCALPVTVAGLILVALLEQSPSVAGIGLVERVLAGGGVLWASLVALRCRGR